MVLELFTLSFILLLPLMIALALTWNLVLMLLVNVSLEFYKILFEDFLNRWGIFENFTHFIFVDISFLIDCGGLSIYLYLKGSVRRIFRSSKPINRKPIFHQNQTTAVFHEIIKNCFWRLRADYLMEISDFDLMSQRPINQTDHHARSNYASPCIIIAQWRCSNWKLICN